MQNITVYYRAEADYHRERVSRDWSAIRARRAARAASRNQVSRTAGADNHAA